MEEKNAQDEIADASSIAQSDVQVSAMNENTPAATMVVKVDAVEKVSEGSAEKVKEHCLPCESEEVLTAKKLLAERGYTLIPRRRLWEWLWHKVLLCRWKLGVCKQRSCLWLKEKKSAYDIQAEVNRKRKAEIRAQREKEELEERQRSEAEEVRRAEILRNEVRLAELAEESKRAETLRNEVRLAELRAEEARRRDADEAKKNEVQSEARESTDAQLGQTSHKKYCSICGDELRPGARFCRKCGNRVEMLEAKGIDM